MSKKKKAKPITTRKKGTRSKTQKDFDRYSQDGISVTDDTLGEALYLIHTGRPLRGQLKGYAQ